MTHIHHILAITSNEVLIMLLSRKLERKIISLNNSSEGIKVDKIKCLISIKENVKQDKVFSRLSLLSKNASNGSDDFLIRVNTYNPDKKSIGLPIYKGNFKIRYGLAGNRQIARIGISPYSHVNSHYISLELNPSIITNTGEVVFLEENQHKLAEALKKILGVDIYDSLYKTCIVSRLDHAIDLIGIHIYDLFLHVKGIKTLKTFPHGCQYCYAETICHGSFSAQCPVKLYNKLIQTNGKYDDIFDDWTRLELTDKRGNDQGWTPENLQSKLAVKNPFLGTTFYPSNQRMFFGAHSKSLKTTEKTSFFQSVVSSGINLSLNARKTGQVALLII